MLPVLPSAPGAIPFDFKISVQCTMNRVWWCLKSTPGTSAAPWYCNPFFPLLSPMEVSLWLALYSTGSISASLQNSHN